MWKKIYEENSSILQSYLLKPYNCGLCKYYCIEKESFITHLRSDKHQEFYKRGNTTIECIACPYTSYSSEDLEKHFMDESVHTDPFKMFRIIDPTRLKRQSTIDSRTNVFAGLDESGNRQKKGEFVCSYCSAYHASPVALLSHIASKKHRKMVHNDQKNMWKTIVEDNQRFEGSEILNPFHCKMCKFYCFDKSDILCHLMSDEHRAYFLAHSQKMKCQPCGYVADSLEDMEKHYKDDSLHRNRFKQYKIVHVITSNVEASAVDDPRHQQFLASIKNLKALETAVCPECGKQVSLETCIICNDTLT